MTHIADNGVGQTVKLGNQADCALNNLAKCEGLLVAVKVSVDMEKIFNKTQGGRD